MFRELSKFNGKRKKGIKMNFEVDFINKIFSKQLRSLKINNEVIKKRIGGDKIGLRRYLQI